MIKIIKKAKVYNPDFLGVKDVLIVNGKIGAIENEISMDVKGASDVYTEIDASNKVLVPGFIDSHTHLMGGGGEGGFKTRTPEAVLTDFTMSGITTVVGCLGTDGITRNMEALLAKAKGLDEEGLNTYIYSGSYRVPIVTITGDVMKDFIIVDKVIGVGEIAISDHRGSQVTQEEFEHLAADARVGGMLSGKAGILNIHMGDGKKMLDLILNTIERTDIPITQFLPTHINRNPELFEEGIKFAKMGGYIDFTASNDPEFWESQEGEIRTSKGIKRLISEGVAIDNFTISSDSQGSLPIFNDKHEFIGLGVGKSESLLKEIQNCVFEQDIPLEIAIRAVTSSPAKILKLTSKGRIETGYDADFCLLEEKTLNVHTVICRGRTMVEDKKPVVLGTFQHL